jgi:hypothetical protein
MFSAQIFQENSFLETKPYFSLTEKCFLLTNFSNSKQTQKSLESNFLKITFWKQTLSMLGFFSRTYWLLIKPTRLGFGYPLDIPTRPPKLWYNIKHKNKDIAKPNKNIKSALSKYLPIERKLYSSQNTFILIINKYTKITQDF